MADVLFAFDMEKRRPACALVAAAMGADSSIPSRYFDSNTWLLAPTPAMQVYRLPEDELPRIADEVNGAPA